ncbi:hypothetical protein [Microbacterium sp. NPDC076911]|uniref:ferritin-like domain-containing protein n=1 Tax=Microbacterium sp. NPDC076911 TaxID=3154958 RepID=UPI0034440DB9
MNMKLAVVAITTVVALGVTGCTAATQSTESATAPSATSSTLDPPGETSATEPATEALPDAPAPGTVAAIVWEALMGPDGEYAASASYLDVIEEFGNVEPYVSIQAAEDRHSEALIKQLNRLGVAVPDNPYLGNIPAPDDLESAAMAWAEGEVANVAMYDDLLAQTDDTAIVRVLTNLRDASADSHLPAFEAAAANGGTLTSDQMTSYLGAN